MYTSARTHTQVGLHNDTHAVSQSVAGERPVCETRVMAQYAPQGYVLSDEQEYLQAYEDVLEKYKGRSGSVRWGSLCDEEICPVTDS